jgi:hypothetical protein
MEEKKKINYLWLRIIAIIIAIFIFSSISYRAGFSDASANCPKACAEYIHLNTTGWSSSDWLCDNYDIQINKTYTELIEHKFSGIIDGFKGIMLDKC